MNAKLKNAAGERQLFIDPRCKELISDMEQCMWEADSYGNVTAVQSKKDRKRTHMSDALGISGLSRIWGGKGWRVSGGYGMVSWRLDFFQKQPNARARIPVPMSIALAGSEIAVVADRLELICRFWMGSAPRARMST